MEWTTKGQELLQAARRFHHSSIDFFRRQEPARAIKFLNEALRCRRQVLPDSHPQVIATLEFLLHIMSQSRTIEEQIPYLEMLLEGKKQRFGRCHLETEQTMSQLASVFERLGRKTDAEALNTDIWSIRCMSSSQRQAVDFDDAFSKLIPQQQRTTQQAKTLVPIEDPADQFRPVTRTSAFVESNEWLERIHILMKLKPAERDAQKAQWEKEDKEKKMSKVFTSDFFNGGGGEGATDSGGTLPAASADGQSLASDQQEINISQPISE
ncbi:Hypothetical protein, putative [Bodo saltans]|uniref:Uncharacterized protein n=1 Tax=Bodo saltans TaxID=75058 RepID=A0A0S4IUR1_BODSA|nr:Hypothetical protein, putative [Bodo saltans]|eukprot:CUF36694.1 Hypothetical protein, putative [Bodo saltans]